MSAVASKWDKVSFEIESLIHVCGAVSVAMNSMVHSQNLFSSIVTAIRDVEEGKGRETVLERKRNKTDGAYKPGTSNSKMTSSRQIPI